MSIKPIPASEMRRDDVLWSFKCDSCRGDKFRLARMTRLKRDVIECMSCGEAYWLDEVLGDCPLSKMVKEAND